MFARFAAGSISAVASIRRSRSSRDCTLQEDLVARRQFGTIRRLPSGRYQARHRDSSGRQVAGPSSFATNAEAQRWLATLQADFVRGATAIGDGSRIRFSAWAEEWLRLKPGQRATTVARDRVAIRTHFEPILGDLRLGAITPAHIRRVVEVMQGRGLAPKSVRTYVGTLQAIFAAAVDADLLVKSPVRVRTLGLQPVPRRERPTLDAEQLERLASAVPDRYAALVLVAGVVGLRWGEAVGLRIADIDFLRRSLTVEQTVEEVSGHVRIVAATKTDASRRRFALPPFLVERLAEHVARFRPDAAQDDLLFVGPKGGVLRRSFEGRTFKPAVAATGLPANLTFHGLRHVATSLLVANGEHPKVIQARLGHADPAVSIGVYAHVPEELDRAAASRLDALFTAARGEARPKRRRR